MTLSRLIAAALGSIRRNAARSLLTALGVVIGVASVGGMVAIAKGAEVEVARQIASLGSNLVVVTPGVDRKGGVSAGAGSMDSLKIEDVHKLMAESLEAAAVTPVIRTFSMAVAGGNNWRTPIYGVDSTYFDIRRWSVQSGRVFDELDVKNNRKVCLLGTTVAENLFGTEDPVGRTLRLRGIPLEVVGLLTKKGQTAEGNDQDDAALLPYTTVRARMAGRQFLAQVLLSARSESALPALMAETRSILRESHHLGANAEDDFTVQDQSQIAEAARGATEVLTTLLLVVASVSLVVGGIGIMNIMLVSVTERTREIGIRRALGARRSDVLWQFLVEAVVLSTLGGLLGTALGVGVTGIVGSVTGWTTSVTVESVLVALGFAFAVGVFFGWWPARRAAALDPIEALRFQ